jgi:hypothetical protein
MMIDKEHTLTVYESDRPSCSYAREKFWIAVHCLATSSSSIQARLERAAAGSLGRLKSEDLPEGLQTEFAGLWRDLTKKKACGDEGTIAATTRQLSDEEAEQVARRVMSMYTRLIGGI